jgi:hypothetical protein
MIFAIATCADRESGKKSSSKERWWVSEWVSEFYGNSKDKANNVTKL